MCKCSKLHPEQGFIFQNIINYLQKSLFTIDHIGNPWKQTVKARKTSRTQYQGVDSKKKKKKEVIMNLGMAPTDVLILYTPNSDEGEVKLLHSAKGILIIWYGLQGCNDAPSSSQKWFQALNNAWLRRCCSLHWLTCSFKILRNEYCCCRQHDINREVWVEFQVFRVPRMSCHCEH